MLEIMTRKEFGERLAKLRISANVSAREMSLAIAQHHGYINNIENGRNYPSMEAFFYICQYLDITPMEFFDVGNVAPKKLERLTEKMKGLKSEQLQVIESVVNSMKQG